MVRLIVFAALLLAVESGLTTAKIVCPQDGLVNSKIRDKKFTDEVVRCIMNEGPCHGRLTKNIKRMTPEVFRGLCPQPCDACMQKQVRKAITFMQNTYPAQFSELVRRHSG